MQEGCEIREIASSTEAELDKENSNVKDVESLVTQRLDLIRELEYQYVGLLYDWDEKRTFEIRGHDKEDHYESLVD